MDTNTGFTNNKFVISSLVEVYTGQTSKRAAMDHEGGVVCAYGAGEWLI